MKVSFALLASSLFLLSASNAMWPEEAERQRQVDDNRPRRAVRFAQDVNEIPQVPQVAVGQLADPDGDIEMSDSPNLPLASNDPVGELRARLEANHPISQREGNRLGEAAAQYVNDKLGKC